MEQISIADFAKHFGITRDKILRRILNGKIPAKKIGKYWVIDAKELTKWKTVRYESEGKVPHFRLVKV